MYGENATLIAINSPAISDPDGYGDVDQDSIQVWGGSAPAYLRRRRTTTKSQDQSTVTNRDELFVRVGYGVPFDELKAGDQSIASTITVADRRTGTINVKTYRIVDIDNRAGGTIVDACRLVLDDVRD